MKHNKLIDYWTYPSIGSILNPQFVQKHIRNYNNMCHSSKGFYEDDYRKLTIIIAIIILLLL